MSKNVWCTDMERLTALVTSVLDSTRDVKMIYFTLASGGVLDYVAGQYITVYFDSSSTREGKAYSLASAPNEKQMIIVVKKVGEFSSLLHKLKVGDTFQISRCYGFFNPLSTRPLVCIAAGVGIAPIWSVLKQEYHKDESRIAKLFFSNKTVDDIVFAEEIKSLKRRHSFQAHHYITRQPKVPNDMKNERIHIDDCTELRNNADYLICGSADFVRSIWKGLINREISTERISTEVFFES